MKVGDEVVLTARGEAEIEAAARHVSELVFGRAMPYAVPMLSAGERALVMKDVGDGLFECRFAYGTVLCNEAMVEGGMKWFPDDRLTWFCIGMLVERLARILAAGLRRAWLKGEKS